MRKPNTSILTLITLLFVVFILGYFLGMNHRKSQITVAVTKEITEMPQETLPLETETSSSSAFAIFLPVPINKAGKDALTTLPGIGDLLAQRIIDYREIHGDFTAVEDLLNVEGIGRKRLEQIQDWIVIGG